MVAILILPCWNIFIRFGRKSLARYWARPGWVYLVFMAMLMLIGRRATHFLRYNTRNQIGKLYTRFNSSCVCGLCILYNSTNGARQLKLTFCFFSTPCTWYAIYVECNRLGKDIVWLWVPYSTSHSTGSFLYYTSSSTVSVPYFKLWSGFGRQLRYSKKYLFYYL